MREVLADSDMSVRLARSLLADSDMADSDVGLGYGAFLPVLRSRGFPRSMQAVLSSADKIRARPADLLTNQTV